MPLLLPTLFLLTATGAVQNQSPVICITEKQAAAYSTQIVVRIDRSPFQTKDRDVFRIGVGVDLFKLFKKEEKS